MALIVAIVDVLTYLLVISHLSYLRRSTQASPFAIVI